MPTKISHELDNRLRTLPPEGKVRAVVLLDTGIAPVARTRRLSHEERQSAAGALREAESGALASIDAILAVSAPPGASWLEGSAPQNHLRNQT